ncbi:response regulator transcription factor [Arthrobacter sp. NPDC080082]|uniref:response regulator transcription factor n=1 Tax=unclassified Arthrobacter TaxID=235627 RepID=UPI0034267C64
MSSRHTLPRVETPAVPAGPAAPSTPASLKAASGPVLIIHPGHDAASTEVAGELAAAGWSITTPGRTGYRKPSAVVFDVTDHSETSATRIARARKTNPGVPFLFLTTREILPTLLTAGSQPGDDYLLTPFTPGDAELRLRWITRHANAALSLSDPKLTVGDLNLRPRWLLAQRGDHRIPVTKTQCAVLELLMQNPGNVVRKDEIADHVWPDTPGRSGTNVELYISYLRKKINAAGPPMIHTLRGVGYLIKPDPTTPLRPAKRAITAR